MKRTTKSRDRKWGHLAELHAYATSPDEGLARYLRVTPKTLRAWRSGERPVPWWVPELLRLRQWEKDDYMRRMGYQRIGIVKPGAAIHELYSLTLDGRRVRATLAAKDAAARKAAEDSVVAEDWGLMRA